MAFPRYKDIELPLLHELNAASGGRTSPIAIYERVAEHFPTLTAADLKVITRNRRPSPIWNNMVQWARNELVKKGEIEPPSVSGRGIWAISDKGRARLARERHLLPRRAIRRSEPIARENGSEYEERVIRLREARSRTQRQLVGIGAILQRFALSDFQQDGFQYDVIWKQAQHLPRATHCFQIDSAERLPRAAAAEARFGYLGRKAVSGYNRRIRNPNRARKAYAALQRRVSGNRRRRQCADRRRCERPLWRSQPHARTSWRYAAKLAAYPTHPNPKPSPRPQERRSHMRILHFADLHIGVENYGKVDPATGLSSRLGDFLHTYDELVDYAIDTQVDLALFCGDAYKSRDPSQTHQREFAKRIARLSAAGIPTFLLVGNHDTPQVIAQATALEIFPTLNVRNVYIGDRLNTYLVETKDGAAAGGGGALD